MASQGPILSGLRTELAPGSPAFRQLPKYVDGSVDSRSCHVPRAHTKENMECFLDDIVSIQSHAFLWEGCEEGSRLAAGGGPLLRHAVLSADVGPRAVPTAKGVCAGCTAGWLSRGQAAVALLVRAARGRHQPCHAAHALLCVLPPALSGYISLPHVGNRYDPAHVSPQPRAGSRGSLCPYTHWPFPICVVLPEYQLCVPCPVPGVGVSSTCSGHTAISVNLLGLVQVRLG